MLADGMTQEEVEETVRYIVQEVGSMMVLNFPS
jgi:hypothetical protein